MVLFLQWWWSYSDTKIMDSGFFWSLDISKKLLYIPTAMIWSFTYEECYSYILNIIDDLGLSIEVEMISDLQELSDTDLSHYSWVYIWGGNTFRLLYEIKKTNLDIKILKYLKDGGVVCGWSAWAIIFWNNINTSPDANIVNIKNIEGLDLVKWYSVRCHYNPIEEKQILEYIKYHNVSVIALTEKSGIKIIDDKIVFIWDDSVVFSKGKRKFFRAWDIGII
jgi:dipeptidase E